jgi:hypothetical protein
MATCIFYEFLLANKYPKDKRFCHNALVFAPDKTVLQSLKEIMTFDKSLVVPQEYARVLDANIKIHFLEDTGTTLNTLDDSNFNIIISNTQKIIVKRKHKEDSSVEKLFKSSSLLGNIYDEDDFDNDTDLMFNQRFQKLCRLSQIGVYVDEAHHMFGKELEKDLRTNAAQTSLRSTINLLADDLTRRGTNVVGCYNYTGTPYVNNQVLPEVVYAYGLRESITNGYLKEVDVQGYENVKNVEFLTDAIKDFWDKYGNKFSSCNVANYKQNANNRELKWCGKCAKCANSYLLFAPFVAYEEQRKIFGHDLFEDADLVEIYKGLLGVDGVMKPFECVASRAELKKAYHDRLPGYGQLPFEV